MLTLAFKLLLPIVPEWLQRFQMLQMAMSRGRKRSFFFFLISSFKSKGNSDNAISHSHPRCLLDVYWPKWWQILLNQSLSTGMDLPSSFMIYKNPHRGWEEPSLPWSSHTSEQTQKEWVCGSARWEKYYPPIIHST